MQNKVIIGSSNDITPQIINNELVKNVEKRILIGSNLNAKNFVMRLFTVKPNGHSPKHIHRWEHEVYVVKGNGEIFDSEKYVPMKEGDFILVPSNVEHQFRNNSNEDLQFICVIPKDADEE